MNRNNKLSREVREWISSLSGELTRDAVGLWQIIPAGVEKFRLGGDDLLLFVELCISSLLAAGAVPVKRIPSSQYRWTVQKHYGDNDTQIIENVIKEWQHIGNDSLNLSLKGFGLLSHGLGNYILKLSSF